MKQDEIIIDLGVSGKCNETVKIYINDERRDDIKSLAEYGKRNYGKGHWDDMRFIINIPHGTWEIKDGELRFDIRPVTAIEL